MMTTGREARPGQKTTIEQLLDDEQVLVHINPEAPGVIIPTHLASNRTVTLRLSRYFKGDLVTDDEKVTAELLFGAAYFPCTIPWSSIWGASSMRGEEYIWTEAAPEDILQLVLSQQRQQQASTPTEGARASSSAGKSKQNHLRRVK